MWHITVSLLIYKCFLINMDASYWRIIYLLFLKSEKLLTFTDKTANSFLYFKSISELLMNNWWYTLLAPFTKQMLYVICKQTKITFSKFIWSIVFLSLKAWKTRLLFLKTCSLKISFLNVFFQQNKGWVWILNRCIKNKTALANSKP